jgi:hypothetical protein
MSDLAAFAETICRPDTTRTRYGTQTQTHPRFAEMRAVDATSGSAGYAIPPAWLMDQWLDVPRADDRPAANLAVQNPLPGGTARYWD